MFDFRLKVFITVAKRLNFTKAAEELFISQPAVTKHIKEIESYYQCQLFERSGNRISLTESGKILLTYGEEIMEKYRQIDRELSFNHQKFQGKLIVGASTTYAQYILPKYLVSIKQKFPLLELQIVVANTENIEHLLLENKIDVGIVEGKSKRSQIKYMPILKDEMILCTSINTHFSNNLMTIKELEKLPLIIREQGSGSLEVVLGALQKWNYQFSNQNIEIILENTESIKNYLFNSNAFAFLSISSIYNELKAKSLKIIDIENVTIERYFYSISKQGDNNSLKEIFLKTITSNN